MCDESVHLFIFTTKETDRILAIKKSYSADFVVQSQEWNCYELVSERETSLPRGLEHIWTPLQGLRPAEEATTESQTNHYELLRKKVLTLLSIKANLNVIWAAASKQFQPSHWFEVPLSASSLSSYAKLMLQEQGVLKAKLDTFFESFRCKVELAQTCAEVEALYQHLVLHVTLGGYAVYGEARSTKPRDQSDESR